MSFVRAGQTRKPLALTPLAGALVLALGSVAAQAQSLSAVYETARSYDPTYLGARAQADSAQFRAEQAHAGLRPLLNLSLSGARSSTDTSSTDNALTPGSGTSSSSTSSHNSTPSYDARITAQQTIYNRATSLGIDQADKGVEAASIALQQAEQDLIVRVSQAYFDVLSSSEALKSVQANVKAIEQQLASAKRNFEVGNATITDTREAEARYDLARAQELQAQNDLEVKKVALDQLVGRAGVAPQALALPVTLPPVLPSQASDWVRLAESDSPGLRLAQINLEVAKLGTAKAKAGHLPTVGMSAYLDHGHNSSNTSYTVSSRNVDGQGFSAPGYDNLTGTSNGKQIAIQVNVPLFSGNAIENLVKEQVLLQEKSRNDLDAAKITATTGTRTAFLGAQSGLAQVKALEAAEVSSKLALEATQLGYKVGVKVNIDVLNAQNQLFQTQRDLAKARYDYLLTTLRLRQAAGQLKADDLLAINALLTK